MGENPVFRLFIGIGGALLFGCWGFILFFDPVEIVTGDQLQSRTGVIETAKVVTTGRTARSLRFRFSGRPGVEYLSAGWYPDKGGPRLNGKTAPRHGSHRRDSD